jgi:hypothetical protein
VSAVLKPRGPEAIAAPYLTWLLAFFIGGTSSRTCAQRHQRTAYRRIPG